MGVVELVREEPDVAAVWLLSTGKVLSCNATFTDWLGFRQSDLNGQPLTDFVVEQQEVDRYCNKRISFRYHSNVSFVVS